MPRVNIKKKEYKLTDFRKWLIGEMRSNGVTQNDVAKWLGISQQAVSKKLKTSNFDLFELITIFDELGVDKDKAGMLLTF